MNVGEIMKCPRCQTNQNKYFFKLQGHIYCRKCILFQRVDINNYQQGRKENDYSYKGYYKLEFILSVTQQKVSHQLLEYYKQKKNSLVWAVCGSGKTEIVYETIDYALRQGQRVCFCIPRRELVIEIYERLINTFYNIDIGLVYGGCQKNLDAQFIVSTMHQLYRFEHSFDLMIADEVDAFPFYQDEVLESIFQCACKGQYIKLSATIGETDSNEELLIISRRYHGYDLPIPQMILLPDFLQLLLMFALVKRHNRWLIYVPSISKVDEVVSFLKSLKVQVAGVSSKHNENNKVIEEFREDKLQVLVTTTLLERGITFENVHVIILFGHHKVFDQRTLIQIAGRVGRKVNFPSGKVYILSRERTKSIKGCIKTLRKLNQMDA